jgi:outer membrane protein OmpA-like peptidoglycan-associated protein
LVIAAAVVCAWAQQRITVPGDFPTIQRALAEAVDGDTVFVRNGVYYENITLVDDVVLMGQDNKSTIIDGRRRGPVVTGADGAVITGFTIRNGTTGILCKNTRPIIFGNIIKDNKGTGIHALVSLPDIVNNVIYRNEWTGIFLESVRGTRTSINHNVIMENGYGGIFCAGRTEVLVRNNIMYKNKQYGIFLGPDAVRTRIVSNNIYANRLPFNEAADNQTVRQMNMSESPQFVSAGFPRHNYNIRSNSPLKGRGEEGVDIGLSETVVALANDPGMGERRTSEFDSFFGAPAPDPVPSTRQDVFQPEPPAPAPTPVLSGPPPMEIRGTVVLHGVSFFDTESAELAQESHGVLDGVYNTLVFYPNLRIEIAGHTDNQGSEDFNRTLSLNRARAVMNYLVDRGIDRGRLRARGYGMERPIDTNDTESGRANNRRVEVSPID